MKDRVEGKILALLALLAPVLTFVEKYLAPNHRFLTCFEKYLAPNRLFLTYFEKYLAPSLDKLTFLQNILQGWFAASVPGGQGRVLHIYTIRLHNYALLADGGCLAGKSIDFFVKNAAFFQKVNAFFQKIASIQNCINMHFGHPCPFSRADRSSAGWCK